MKIRTAVLSLLLSSALIVPVIGQGKWNDKIEKLAQNVEPKVIAWRHYIHQYPELSNREFKTAEKIAAHLESLGMEVQTGVAHTGVVGLLKGGKPGPVVALRADIDALPVVERVDIPWASKVKTKYNDLDVGVMHACGHDTHTAILMGVAEVLTELKPELKGTVKFIFQPAEEGAPVGEEGGAELMIKEGVLKSPDVDAIFGLHIWSGFEVGTISYKPGGILAAANSFEVRIKGKQTHGSTPWTGIDPIVTATQIVNNLQTIVSRSLPLTEEGAVVSIGRISGGVRSNIIPEEVYMEGTIRALDMDMQKTIFKRMQEIVEYTAKSNGAEAELIIRPGYPVTYNDPELTASVVSTLNATAGEENVYLMKAITGAEDFSFFQKEVPGFFFMLGGMPKGQDPATAVPHHTPDFFVDDSSMLLGIKTLSQLTVDYMNKK